MDTSDITVLNCCLSFINFVGSVTYYYFKIELFFKIIAIFHNRLNSITTA